MELKKILALSSLLVSSTLAAESTSISDICLSDAYLCKETPHTPEEILKKFDQKIQAWGGAVDQLERFFAPLTRRGSQEIRDLANLLIDHATLKYNKLFNMKLYYESHRGDKKYTFSDCISTMENAPPKAGRHAELRRKRDTKKEEIKKIEGEVIQLGVDAENINKLIKDEDNRLVDLDKKISAIDFQKKECTDKIDAIGLALSEHQKFMAEQVALTAHSEASSEAWKAQIEVENEKRVGLTQERANLNLTLGNLQKEERELHEEKEKITEKLKEYNSTLEMIPEKKATLEKVKQEKKNLYQHYQDRADLYALVKYISTLNIYAALPNTEYNLKEYEKDRELEILPSLSLGATQEILYKTQQSASQWGAEQIVPSIIAQTVEKMKVAGGKIQKERPYLENAFKENVLNDSIRSYLKQCFIDRGIYNVSNDYLNALIIEMFKMIKRHALEPNYVNTMEKCKPSPDQSSWKISLPGHIPSLTEEQIISSISSELRVDKLFKKSMNDWRRKISQGEGSLIHRYGLTSYLFNKNVSPSLFPVIILPPKKMTEELPKNAWNLGLTQLNQNWCGSLMEMDVSQSETLRSRITPIYKFVKEKAIRERDHPEKTYPKNTTIEHVFLKYISYANLYYGLTYSVLGEKIELLPLPEYITLDNQEMRSFSIENIMAIKAHKWLSRLLKLDQEREACQEKSGQEVSGQENHGFVHQHALKAWMLAEVESLE